MNFKKENRKKLIKIGLPIFCVLSSILSFCLFLSSFNASTNPNAMNLIWVSFLLLSLATGIFSGVYAILLWQLKANLFLKLLGSCFFVSLSVIGFMLIAYNDNPQKVKEKMTIPDKGRTIYALKYQGGLFEGTGVSIYLHTHGKFEMDHLWSSPATKVKKIKRYKNYSVIELHKQGSSFPIFGTGSSDFRFKLNHEDWSFKSLE